MVELILGVSDTFIVARMTVLIVVGATFALVAISERMRRKELVDQAVKSGTQSLESELTKARDSLDSIKRLAVLQENEILKQKWEIDKLKQKISKAGMESL